MKKTKLQGMKHQLILVWELYDLDHMMNAYEMTVYCKSKIELIKKFKKQKEFNQGRIEVLTRLSVGESLESLYFNVFGKKPILQDGCIGLYGRNNNNYKRNKYLTKQVPIKLIACDF